MDSLSKSDRALLLKLAKAQKEQGDFKALDAKPSGPTNKEIEKKEATKVEPGPESDNDPAPQEINDDPVPPTINEEDLGRDKGITTPPVTASKEEEKLSGAFNDQRKASQDTANTLPRAQKDTAPARRRST